MQLDAAHVERAAPSRRRWHAQDAARPPTAIPQGLAAAAKTFFPAEVYLFTDGSKTPGGAGTQ